MDLLSLFKSKQALLEGHFILSSGLHSDRYMQSALLLQYPDISEDLGKRLADYFPQKIDTVISPAIGGLIIGQEVARAKKCRAIFSEKNEAGRPVLRRGFDLTPQEKVLVVEDVITTGLSTGEVIELVHSTGAELVGIGSVVNRAGGENPTLAKFGKPVFSLLNLKVESWKPENCALCKKGIPAVKPGSRKN
ncbi:MAG: Orotate phosphoribosyltransferase [Elusimicrobia bacterium]|nr:Orotate phosphoribosyltransferase [Elusimicrobiota bacterium]